MPIPKYGTGKILREEKDDPQEPWSTEDDEELRTELEHEGE